MLFAILCDDKPGSLDLRMATRPEHVAYLEALGDRLKFAGPFIGADEKPAGSLLMVDVDTRQAAEAIAADDPYAAAGLFARTDIRRWTWAIKNPDA